MTVRWFEYRDALPAVVTALRRAEVIVDIGCGIQPQDYLVPRVHICCEPFYQYVDRLKELIVAGSDRKFRDRHYVILHAKWDEALKLLPAKSVDTVFALDVIEHLTKPEGHRLLTEANRIARSQIVLFTPLGFVLQETQHGGKDAWGMDGAEWQAHCSGWTPEDFDDSWDVYASRDFHRTNNLGQPLREPFGAIFAIRNIRDAQATRSIPASTRCRVHGLVDRVFDSRVARAIHTRF